MKTRLGCIAILATLTLFSGTRAQSLSSFDGFIVDLPQLRSLTMTRQEGLFTDKLGEPENITSFTTTTKYKDGKERKVKCDQFRYSLEDAEITCFFFADTDKLGQVAVHLRQGKALPDFKKLFAIFRVEPPAKLGKRQGLSGFYWYNFDNYEGFTRIQVGRNSSGFNGIDFFIDRIE
ncbi:MAG: hypothetical protein NTZ35_01335 [Ignavibacteriales bacterium]|nr:hypothetical protein [Ignavibacteriales bacterium]